MFHGSFHPWGCMDSLCSSILHRTNMDSACIYCTHVSNAFASLVLLESAEDVALGERVMVKRLRKHECIHGKRTRTWRGQRHVENY